MKSPSPAQLADPAWCEAQYNPRLAVADPAALLRDWADRAAATRSRLPFHTLSYGPHPREVFDLFTAPDARGLLVFIHGGYWRAQHKDDFSWVAEAFVKKGISVAVMTYPLCPEVTVSDIVAGCRRALIRLVEAASPAERRAIVLSGHSAGGYLTAAMAATDWTKAGMSTSPFWYGLSLSGVFDLEPLLRTSMNELIRLTPSDVTALALASRTPQTESPLLLTYGEAEPGEFHRQSLVQATAWPRLCPPAVAIKKANHFSIVDQLAEPQSQVFGLVESAFETLR